MPKFLSDIHASGTSTDLIVDGNITGTGNLTLTHGSTPFLQVIDSTNDVDLKIKAANSYGYIELDNDNDANSSRLIIKVDGGSVHEYLATGQIAHVDGTYTIRRTNASNQVSLDLSTRKDHAGSGNFTAGDDVARLNFKARDSVVTSDLTVGSIITEADNTFTSSDQKARMKFQLRTGSSNANVLFLDSDKSASFYGNILINSNTAITSGRNFYGTIFYDADNTSYYLDPASSTISLDVNGRITRGSKTFSGTNGVHADARLGIVNNGSLTSIVNASTYNDANYPDYGLVFIQGPSTSSYNVWSISPDGPAKGSDLNFIYQAQATNIHVQTPMLKLHGSTGNATFTGTVTWSGGGSANANTSYTYSQVGHLPLAGGTMTGAIDFGNVTGRAITITGDSNLDNADASIYLGNATSSYGWDIKYLGTGTGNNNKLQFVSTNAGSPVTALSFTQDGNATFAERVDLQKDLRIRGNDSSGSLGVVRFLTDSNNQLIIDTGNDGSNQTTIDSSGNATFAGDIDGDKITLTQGAYADGYRLVRSGHDTYRIGLGDSEGLQIINETDSGRKELRFDGAGNATFAGDVTGDKFILTDGFQISSSGTYGVFNNWVNVDSTGFYTSTNIFMDLDDSSSRFVVRGVGNTEIFEIDTSDSNSSKFSYPVKINAESLYGLTSTSATNPKTELGGFITVPGAETSRMTYLTGISENKLGGLYRKGSSAGYSLTSTKDGSTITANWLENAFQANDNFSSISSTTSSTVCIIEITVPTMFHGSNAGIAFSNTAWIAKDVKIEVYSGTSWSTIYDVTNSGRSTHINYFSKGSTGVTKLKYTLTNFATTSCRITSIFANNYTGGNGVNAQLYDDNLLYGDQSIQTGYTLSIPSYVYHLNDTNTYFGFEGDDQFRVVVGGSEKIHVNTSRIRVNDDILPAADSAYDIGTSSMRFATIYADTLFGDGSNLTNLPTGSTTTINNNANNRVITGSDTADTLEAESGLTFDGDILEIIGSGTTTKRMKVSPGTDYGRAHIGRAALGKLGFDDHAGFAHEDNNTQTNYALLQSSTANTYVNAASGKAGYLRINNGTIGYWNANGLYVSIYYDKDNTDFYANPASRSQFGSLDLNSGTVWDATTQGTSKGALHLDPNNSTDHAGGAITFGASDTSSGTTAQAGIYVRSDGSYGTRMYLSTTDSYASGSKTTIRLEAAGGLYVDRGNLYSPVYYDKDNTNYYVNPASTSVVNHMDMDSGNTSGKFAVKSSAVHGSYDFYNEGTSYFNNAVTVNAPLYAEEYIYHEGDTDTYIRFTDNAIGLRAAGNDLLLCQRYPASGGTGVAISAYAPQGLVAENLGGANLIKKGTDIAVSTGYREEVTGPDGSRKVQAHVSTGNGNVSNCYHWYSSENVRIDPEKDYEFSVWIKSTGDDHLYLGWHEYKADGGKISSNPYFHTGKINTSSVRNVNGWVLLKYQLKSHRTSSGTADTEGSDRYVTHNSSSNFRPSGSNGVMHSTTTHIHLRLGTCYGSVNGSKSYFYNPKITEAQHEELQWTSSVARGFASESFRSPVFYDNDNTTYYLDAASTGTSLNIAGRIELIDSKAIGWGGNNILSHNGTQTYIGDNSSASAVTITGTNMTVAGDLTVSGGDITLSGTGRIQGIDTVSATTDAASKGYVDGLASNYAAASHNHDDRYYTETESRNKFTTTDGANEDYNFVIDDESNMTGNKWYKVVLISNHNGALHVRGIIGNHVEDFASQKVDLMIQSREANNSQEIEITGTVDVLHNDSSGTDMAGIRIIKSDNSATYHNYELYVRTTRYSMVNLRFTETGNFTYYTNFQSVTSEPAPVSGGNVELDTSTLQEGNYVVDDSTPREIYHEGHKPTYSELGTMAYSNLTGVPSSFTPAQHTQAISTITNLQTSLDSKAYYDHIRSLGSQAFTNGSNPNITTAQVISEIETDGGFDSFTSVFKTSWSYAGNYNLTDAGRFTETAGTSWITWTDNSSDSARGNITALAIAPNTGASAGKVFIYNDQGSSYAPGWREVWTNTSDGAGSGLDADKLDGQEGSHYLNYNNLSNTPQIPTNSTFVDLTSTQTITGAKTFTSTGHKHSGHYYMTAYDSAGNHYPHFLDGSSASGTTVNWRQYYGSGYKTHTWTSDSSGNMQFNFNGNIRALDGIYYGSNTGYYVNPAGDSQMNQIHLADYVRHLDDLDTYFGFNGVDQWKLHLGGGDRFVVTTSQFTSNLNIKAPVYYDDNTSYYLDAGSTNTSLNVAGHIYSGGVIQAGTTLLGNTIICLNGSGSGIHLRQPGTTNVIAKLDGSTESTLDVNHIKGLKLDTANSQVMGYNTTNYGNTYGYLGVDVNGKVGVVEKEITFSIEGTGWVGRHSNPVKLLDAPGADKMIVVQEINILINYTAPIGIGSSGICRTTDNTAYAVGFYQGSGTNGNFTVTGVMPRATMQFTTTTNDRIVNRDVPVEGTKLYPNKALYWKTTRDASSSFGSYPGAQHIVKVRYRIVDVSTEFTGAYASAQNINSSSITSISQAY